MPTDYLSHNVCSVLPVQQQLDLKNEQIKDPQLGVIMKFLKTGTIPPDKDSRSLITKYGTRCFIDSEVLMIRLYHPQYGNSSLVCHTDYYGRHEGALKTTQRLQLYYFWPNMKEDVQRVVDDCETCQKRKHLPAQPPAELQSLPILTQPNHRIHDDLFGPLRTSPHGKKFILVVTNAFTKYVELVAIPNKVKRWLKPSLIIGSVSTEYPSFGKSKVRNEKFARVPAKEVSQILTVYSIESNQFIYNAGIF